MNLQKKHNLFFCRKFWYFLAVLILTNSFVLGFFYVLETDNILFWYLNRGDVSTEAINPFVARVNVAASLFSKKKKVDLTVEEKKLAGIWGGSNDCFIFN